MVTCWALAVPGCLPMRGSSPVAAFKDKMDPCRFGVPGRYCFKPSRHTSGGSGGEIPKCAAPGGRSRFAKLEPFFGTVLVLQFKTFPASCSRARYGLRSGKGIATEPHRAKRSPYVTVAWTSQVIRPQRSKQSQSL